MSATTFGHIVLGMYLTLIGLMQFTSLQASADVMGLLALVAGVLILVGIGRPLVIKKK